MNGLSEFDAKKSKYFKFFFIKNKIKLLFLKSLMAQKEC
jgi:hypothetical protein